MQVEPPRCDVKLMTNHDLATASCVHRDEPLVPFPGCPRAEKIAVAAKSQSKGAESLMREHGGLS